MTQTVAVLLDFFHVGFIVKQGLSRLETKAHAHSVHLARNVVMQRVQDHYASTVNFHWVAVPFVRCALPVALVRERIAAP